MKIGGCHSARCLKQVLASRAMFFKVNTFGDIDWLLMLAVQIYNRSVARVQVIRD